MSATALISGKLWREPEAKVSKAGKTYGTATVRVGEGDGAQWWRVLAFSESAAAELLQLHDGDGVAASGSFKAEPYERGGELRVNLTLFADRLISAKRQKRERDQERRAEPRQGPFDTAEAQRPLDSGLNDDLSEGRE